MLEGEAFELFSSDTQGAAAMNGEILEEETQAIGRELFPGAIFKAVEIFQQRSGVDFGRIILLGKKAADAGEQLQSDRGRVRLLGRKYPEVRNHGPFKPSDAGKGGKSHKGQDYLASRAAHGFKPFIGESFAGQGADMFLVFLDPSRKRLGKFAGFPAGILSPKGARLLVGLLSAQESRAV